MSWKPKKRTCLREETVIKTADRTSKLTTGFGNMNVISDLDKSGSVETWEDIGGSEYQSIFRVFLLDKEDIKGSWRRK